MPSMAATTNSLQPNGDEGYIDMELSSSPRRREFEFQMCSDPKEKETKTFTADELFYKGKLLPLHLIAIAARDKITKEPFEASGLTMPLACATAPCTTSPLDSCNISPSESRRVSCELRPDDDDDDCFFEWSTELSSFVHGRDRTTTARKKSWAQKMKLMRHYSFAQKLKASRAYLKSLFHKSDGSEAEKTDDKSFEFVKKKPFEFMGRAANFHYPTIAAILKNGGSKNNGVDDNVPRRSFSGAIKRHSPAKCLSSSSSSSSSSDSSSGSSSSSSSSFSNSLNEVNVTRRSSSATETEVSIEAAIAHCKESHKVTDLRQKPEIFGSTVCL